jgi:hypothetical protein
MASSTDIGTWVSFDTSRDFSTISDGWFCFAFWLSVSRLASQSSHCYGDQTILNLRLLTLATVVLINDLRRMQL